MLVLARKVGQSIEIGRGIFVTVVDIRGEHVRLGVDAPSNIPVHRHEVAEAIRHEKNRGQPPTGFNYDF